LPNHGGGGTLAQADRGDVKMVDEFTGEIWILKIFSLRMEQRKHFGMSAMSALLCVNG